MGSTNFAKLSIGSVANQRNGELGRDAVMPMRLALVDAAAGSSTFYVSAHSADGSTVTVNKSADYPRNVVAVASGAATSTVTVNGLDFNGYAISEAFTLNGATPVVGKKAFSKVTTVVLPTTSGRTVSVGTGVIFGLPFRMTELTVIKELQDGDTVGTAGTFVLGSTSAGTDYYGTYSPNAAPDAAKDFVLYYIPTDVDSAGLNN